MLTIRREQDRTMLLARQNSFLKRLLPEVLQELEAANAPADADFVQGRLKELLKTALSNGLTRECDVANLALLVCRRLGGDFDKLPHPAQDILRAKGVAPEHKLAMLDDFLNEFPLGH